MRFFYKLTKILKRERIPFKALDSFYDYYPGNLVILTTQKDIEREKPDLPDDIQLLVLSPMRSKIEDILLTICQNIAKINIVEKILIAVDPGEKKVGTALFLNDTMVYSRELYNLRQLGHFLRNTFHHYNDAKKSIKIGDGNFFLAMDYIDYLKNQKIIKKDIEIQLVNEYKTSQKKSFTKNRLKKTLQRKKSIHEKSAILIGQKKGKRFFIDETEY